MTRMSFRIAGACALVVLLAACGPHDRRFNPSHFVDTAAGAPPEVVLPPKTQSGARIFGIVASSASDFGMCCAASARADLPVRKDGDARTLRVGLYAARGIPRRLRVTFPGGRSATHAVTRNGFSVLKFDVPRALWRKHGVLRLRIDADGAPYTLTSIYFE